MPRIVVKLDLRFRLVGTGGEHSVLQLLHVRERGDQEQVRPLLSHAVTTDGDIATQLGVPVADLLVATGMSFAESAATTVEVLGQLGGAGAGPSISWTVSVPVDPAPDAELATRRCAEATLDGDGVDALVAADLAHRLSTGWVPAAAAAYEPAGV